MSDKPKFVYVIYIASSAERVFEALTSAEMSERYWHGARAVSDWKVGSPFALKLPRERNKDVTGTVLEYDPLRRLAYSFQPHHGGMEGEAPSRVTFEIETYKDQVKVTVVHEGFEPGGQVFEAISKGWPLVLSSLKSFVESGRVLRAPWYDDAEPQTAGACR
jgi:uncharacterized protein YndB with AHSA1/START domain